jgi:hypothetical protein
LQIGTTKNDILKLFDSIEKYGMSIFFSLLFLYIMIIFGSCAAKAFLIMAAMCLYSLNFHGYFYSPLHITLHMPEP